MARKLMLYVLAVVGLMPTAAFAYQPMYDYWASFSDGTLARAVDFAGDMLPVLAVLAGLAIAERVLGIVLRSTRG